MYNRTMPGVLVNDSRAKAFIKVTLPKSMQQQGLPTIERFGFDTREHAKETVRNFLNVGIQAKME